MKKYEKLTPPQWNFEFFIIREFTAFSQIFLGTHTKFTAIFNSSLIAHLHFEYVRN